MRAGVILALGVTNEGGVALAVRVTTEEWVSTGPYSVERAGVDTLAVFGKRRVAACYDAG
ncbi:hypothetical protein DVH26_34880 [Paenibacillus sp. H1-7]|nr:hypothetical protein DVH26_34880 [Paenibacillus sp. H1-7]